MAGFEGGGKGPEPQNARKGEETDSLPYSSRGSMALLTLSFWLSDPDFTFLISRAVRE